MNMRKLMTEWKKFVEVKKYKRVVLNELTELTEEEVKAFPLSQEELDIVRHWGGLEGEPLFLGSGTMGSAFQFGNKVLKITSDAAEANAATAIKGLKYPHVYTIHDVGLRQTRFKEMPNQRFMIVYDLVAAPQDGGELPSKEAQEVIKSIHNTTEKIKFNHPQNFKDLLMRFLEAAQQNSEVFDIEDNSKKIDKIIQITGMGYSEKEAVKLSLRLILGLYGKCYNSAESLAACMERKEFDYYDQVCSGLTFLAEHGIFFTDLKTTNVMRVDDDQLVIIDIGKSVVRGGYSEIPEIK
jgi:serine/threonine protein kinase